MHSKHGWYMRQLHMFNLKDYMELLRLLASSQTQLPILMQLVLQC